MLCARECDLLNNRLFTLCVQKTVKKLSKINRDLNKFQKMLILVLNVPTLLTWKERTQRSDVINLL